MLANHKQMVKKNNTRSQNRGAALGRPAMKLLGGGGGGGAGGGGLQLVCGRPTFARSSALVPQTLSYMNVVLRKLRKYYKTRCPKTGLKHLRHLHDNAPTYKAYLVTDFLSQ